MNDKRWYKEVNRMNPPKKTRPHMSDKERIRQLERKVWRFTNPLNPKQQTKITLKAARVNAGLKQSDVEKKLGFSHTTLVCWESGKRVPRADLLAALCDLYGVSMADIAF